MEDSYFDVMKICELINFGGQNIREEEVLKSHNYTRAKYDDELNKLILEGKQSVTINYNEFLGKGGIASVYTCNIKKEKNLECKYAIKLIDISKPSNHKISIAEQIIPLCKINHENIISVHSLKVIKEKNKYFYGIVFQYIENITTLDNFIKNNNSILTKYETFKILHGLVAGIEALHKNNFIHSDITLNNILITPDISVVYIDPDVTKLYWKNQLDNALNIISTIVDYENTFLVEEFGKNISQKILSDDISKINGIIKLILKKSELDYPNLNIKIATIDDLKILLKELF